MEGGGGSCTSIRPWNLSFRMVRHCLDLLKGRNFSNMLTFLEDVWEVCLLDEAGHKQNLRFIPQCSSFFVPVTSLHFRTMISKEV